MPACLFHLLALVVLAGNPLGPGDHTRSLKMGEVDRSYLVHVPPKYDAKKPTPVVLVLHGAGTNGAITVFFCGMNKKADEAGFIAVYPNGTGLAGLMLTWNAGRFQGKEGKADDVAFIAKLLDDLATVVNVDPKRVYATGISNGGMMCYRLAAELSDRIAAIAPVAGTMAIDKYNPKRPVPVMHFHGTADKMVPFAGPGSHTPKVTVHTPASNEGAGWWAR
jgi:polyhydroxybutyrate depolymerase